MVFDTRLEQLRQHFGICVPEDWRDVAPTWITALHGYGPGILNYLRLELACRGLTLRDDRTAEFWKEHLDAAHLDQPLGDPDAEENAERHAINPFVVLIDSAEQQPFGFQNLRQDASEGGRPLIVPTEWRALGRYGSGAGSQGDYSIDGYIGRVAIERKSMADAHSTFLGWGGHRERFESELENLAAMPAGAVVVECSFQQLIQQAPQWGVRTREQNAKALMRSVISWQQTWPGVAWFFCDSRRLAEIVAFNWLREFWKREREAEKAASKQQARETSKEAAACTSTS